MESPNVEIPANFKQSILREALKFGIALVILLIATYAMWVKMNEDQRQSDKRVEESIKKLEGDVESLKKDNRECNDFTKSILLKEVQESNALQEELSEFLKKRS